jgi:ribulose 1,5-bisphosphate carboxylase large subunit-like protein
MYKNLILKYHIKEKNISKIKIFVEKIIADASIGTNYVITNNKEEFLPHKINYNEKLKAKLLNQKSISKELTELVFKIPLYFENKMDFFSMFITCIGEAVGFHSEAYLIDFEIDKDPFKLSTSQGPKKYINYLNKPGPYIGAIIKPNICSKMNERIKLIRKLMLNGIDFIKDDEVFGLKNFNQFKIYVTKVNNIKKEIYQITNQKCLVCFNITAYSSNYKKIQKMSLDGIMINYIALGFPKSYELIQNLNKRSIIHGHRVGFALFLNKIHPNVLLKLACKLGLDSTHIGTPKIKDIRNYANQFDFNLFKYIVPTFTKVSPSYITPICNKFGKNVLFLPCGGIYQHPLGFEKGIRAFKTAIDLYNKTEGAYFDLDAYCKAIKKWPLAD